MDKTTGTLYGTTWAPGSGTVYSLHQNGGVWTHGILFNFGGSDGAQPYAGVLEDSLGDIYGTTVYGGAYGMGVGYELIHQGHAWTETVIHSFAGSGDGAYPYAELVSDPTTGALYGTTYSGGTSGCGTVFELTRSGGTWTETVLHSFLGGDGCLSDSRVHEDAKGRLFGATPNGGAYGAGVVYMLTETEGKWSETVLYNFTGGSDGNYPKDLDLEPTGDVIYGVTAAGGSSANGTVFEVFKSRGSWREKVLYNFMGFPDGATPLGMHLDRTTTTIYGTTKLGGNQGAGDGTVFELAKSGSSWNETILQNFGYNSGNFPWSRPIEDAKAGILYGTASSGGTDNGGVAYAVGIP